MRSAFHRAMVVVTVLAMVLMVPQGAAASEEAPGLDSGSLAIAVNPTALHFGSLPVGTTATQNVTFRLDAGYRISGAAGSGTANVDLDWESRPHRPFGCGSPVPRTSARIPGSRRGDAPDQMVC